MSLPRVLPALFLAFLLGASILAVQPVGGFPISASQKSTVDQVLQEAPASSEWQTRIQANTFYLHSDPTGSAPAPRFSMANAVPNPRLDVFQPDQDATQGMPNQRSIAYSQTPLATMGNQAAFGSQAGGPVRFPVASDLAAVDTFRVYGWHANIWAGCGAGNVGSSTQPGASTSQTTIRARLYVQEFKEGAWVDRGLIASVNMAHAAGPANIPDYVDQWSGTTTFGNQAVGDGFEVKPGERLVAQFDATLNQAVVGVTETFCVMYYDGFYADNNGNPRYSRVTVTSDALRVAQYLTEESDDPKKGGERRTAFPSAGSTDAPNRRFVVEALQAHAMGPGMSKQLIEDKHANVRIWDLTNGKYVYYLDNSGGGFPREFETEDFKLVSSRKTSTVPEPDIETHLGNGVVRRAFVFSYNETQADIRFRPEFYSYSDSWTLIGEPYQLGGKGFDFKILPGESLTHSVNPREPTEFSFVVTNTGSTDDVITVSANDPGSGWTARVLGGGAFFVSPGRSATGTVEVVPPATAVAGTSKAVTLTASSSFSDVSDPAPITFTTSVVSDVVHKVNVTSIESVYQVRPGEQKGFALVLANEGTTRGSFTVVPIFPSNVQGWDVRVSPASLQLPAGARSTIQVLVRAPAEAATGSQVPLGLTAVQVGNAAISDRVDVTLDVFAAAGVLADLIDAKVNRTMRTDSPDVCVDPLDPGVTCVFGELVPDTDFDNTALFRVPLVNRGDRAASYKVEAFWDKDATGDKEWDDWKCQYEYVDGNFLSDTSNDGVPDGWRFTYGDAVGGPLPETTVNPSRGDYGRWSVTNEGGKDTAAFSGFYILNGTDNPVNVTARSVQDLYFELGWILDDPCPENSGDTMSDLIVGIGGGITCEGRPDGPNNPTGEDLTFECDTIDVWSPVAGLTVVVTDLSNPALVSRATMIAERVPHGAFLGTARYAGAQHAVAVQPEPLAETTLPVAPGKAVAFDLVAYNKGNEKDDLLITVNGATGWTHTISVLERSPASDLCDLPTAGGTSVLCRGLGVYDEVHFQVVATPSTLVRTGDRDSITVTVTSGDAPGISRTLGLTARAAGTLEYAIGALGATTRAVQPGQTVSFPLFVANDGTGDDTYALSIIRGDTAKWKAVLSTSAGLFVPAGHEVPAFLTVTAPVDAAPGATDVFTVRVESKGDQTRKVLDFSPIVQAASSLVVAGKEGQDVLIPQRGVEKAINVTSVQTSGVGASPVIFTVDTASLPRGWTVDRTTASVPANPDASGRPTATAQFKVKAPADALGTARGLLHVEALAGTLRGATDISLNLASTFGLNLTAEEADMVIAPGGDAIYNLTLENLGLGQDTVALTSTALPTGWTVLFNPPTTPLEPLQRKDIQAQVKAPVTAQPGDIASLLVFATSTTEASEVSSLALTATVGFNAIQVERVTPGIPVAAPQETVTFVFNVTNVGTLPDQIQASAVLDTAGQAANVERSGGPEIIDLDPGQSAQVTYNMAYGPNIPSGILLQSTARWVSLLDERPAALRATANETVQSKVLAYQFADVNGDGLRDYAVDRNQDLADGYEQFQATKTPGGRPLAAADLERFLRDDVREALSFDVTLANGTTVRTVIVPLDGDGDGRRDHLLDGDLDGQPDYYWDPDANKASPIDFRKDVNGDQVPESFVDVDGDGRIDAVYDLTRAEFTDVLQIDVDSDGTLDYVVDRDGDGTVDQDETVLYTRTGGLLIVQKVDVDGDDRLDQVFDTDGDGNPDYFIPDGSTESVEIVMRDVTGDGTADWTFDGDGDGRRESYYDPVTGEAHVIDAAGHFMDALKKYWYIGALFVLVLVLFVALVLVTRK